MIVCPVCRHANDDFLIRCSSCSSYIQDRVPNLDFFSIVWMIIESPGAALKKIILAEHKNFVLFLSLFLGVAALFALLWVNQRGDRFDNLLTILLFGSVLGTAAALPLFFILTGTLFAVSKIFNGKGSLLNTYGVAGWALVPVMFSVVFVLPLELGTLGMLLFSGNPSAYEVKPVVTMVLRGMDGFLALWSMLLLAGGIAMVHRFKYVTALFVALISIGIVSGLSQFIFLSF